MKWLDKFIVSERGQWDYPGYPTAVPTKNGRITMEGVPYPVIGFVPGEPPVMMHPGENHKFPGKMVYEIPIAQKGLQTPSDSLVHQLNKIADYEYTRGSDYGTGLPNYGNKKLKNPTKQDAVNWIIQNTVPQVSPYFKSPTEQAEAADFLYNSGRDPRIYMLDQYLQSIGQKGLPNRGSFNLDTTKPEHASAWKTKKAELDKLWKQHEKNINALSENNRRILLNKGRDFYYRNINVKPDGSPSDSYYNTWYGRIWNTNDYAPFDPNNPKFIAPRKKEGGHIVPGRYRNPEGNWLNKYAGGGDISIPNLSRGWLEKYAEGSEVPANLPWINSQGQYQEPVKTSKVLSDDDLRRIDISEISETTDTPAIRLAQQLSVQQYKDWQNRKPVAKKPVSKKQNYNARIAEYSRAEDKKVIDAYYKKYDPANEEQVKAIQTELVAKNFLPGPAAIDGKFGDKTKQAYLKYKTAERVGDLSGETEKSTCSYDGCAEYVSSVTRSYGWVLGDAWTMKNNIETNGGTVKYNIYTDPRFSRVKDIGQLKNVTETVKRNNKASADMFEVGDVVGLYNKGSNMHQTALKDGRGTYNTHVGVVTEIKDGKPIISHNIHGKLHHDSYNNLTIGWIGTPAPRIAQYKPSKQPETLKDKINIYSKELTEILAPGVDSEKIANNIKGILRKETGLGRLTPTEADIKEIQVKRFLLGESTDPEDISRGIGKLKTATIPDDMKYFLGINNENVDDDAGIKAAVYKYVDAYNQLKKYSQNNPQLNLTDEDLHQMSILAYNQGTDKLMNLGYNNPSMPISSEVDALRDLYSGNVKDISSTNFKYLPTINTTILGVPVNIDLGQALYNLRYPEGHESYISRVNKYANTPIEELEASMPSKKLGGWLDRYQDGREVAADATAVKVNPLVRAINIDKAPSNFDYQNYYDKADKYLSRDIFKGTTLTAKDIADAANEFYIESNYQYPLDLLLTQAQIESKLGKALKSKHNYFNVGNTDSGATRDFPSAKDSVKDYMTLMYNNYLNKGQKNVEELLKPKGFVNYEGSRYASNPDYENMLSSQMQFINNYLKGYKNGGWLDKYQVGQEVKSQQNQKYQDAIKWHEDWMNSPMYKQMLYEDMDRSKYPSNETLAGSYDPYYFDTKRKNRLSDLKQTPLNVRSSQPSPGYEAEYRPLYNEISVYPDGYNLPTVMHHEIRHGIEVPIYTTDDRHFNMPAKDYNYLETLNNNRNFQNAALSKQDVFNDEKIWSRYKDYYTNPSEVNARLAEIRKQAQDQKVYDPFTQPIPNDFFKKFDNRALQELKNYYTDEEIQHMLNHFSYNQNESNDTGIYKSKMGGWLDKYQGKTRGSQTVLMPSNATPPANLPWINQQGQFTQVPPVQPKSFEARVDEYLGNPMQKGRDLASWAAGPGNDPVDNLRHMKTAEEITTKGGSSLGSAIVANALGAAHELYVLPQTIKSDGWYHGLRSTAEDLFNNAVGSGIGMLPLPIKAKESLLIHLTDNNMLPDGVSMDKGDMYWKKKKGGVTSQGMGYFDYINGYRGVSS